MNYTIIWYKKCSRKVYNAWVPKQDNYDNRIIMDIIQHKIPEWAWVGINSRRMYLKANTIVDITSTGGKFVP